MANPYINVYNNNPTSGAKDGTAVTTDKSYGNSIRVELDAGQSESKVVKLAVRTVTGFEADSVYITSETTGDVPSNWSFSLTNEPATFSPSLSISELVDDTNTIFYAKATSSSSELPTTDTSESLAITATIYAVAE